MVKINASMLNLKISNFFIFRRYSTTKTNEDYNIKIGNDNNHEDNKSLKPKNNYVKVLVEDPYNNRDIILKLTKKQKGVYV